MRGLAHICIPYYSGGSFIFSIRRQPYKRRARIKAPIVKRTRSKRRHQRREGSSVFYMVRSPSRLRSGLKPLIFTGYTDNVVWFSGVCLC